VPLVCPARSTSALFPSLRASWRVRLTRSFEFPSTSRSIVTLFLFHLHLPLHSLLIVSFLPAATGALVQPPLAIRRVLCHSSSSAHRHFTLEFTSSEPHSVSHLFFVRSFVRLALVRFLTIGIDSFRIQMKCFTRRSCRHSSSL
jgi:hypothetical protein